MILITDADYGISKDNIIPWHFPEDLKFFNKTTVNNVCIMGSNTAKDLGKPLKNRINIVISSNDDCKDLGKSLPDYNGNNFIIVQNFEEAIREASEYVFKNNKEIFVIGGSRLYNEILESQFLDKIYYTHINKSFGCDNFVNPILNREDFTYDIINKIQYEIENIELTFYKISKN